MQTMETELIDTHQKALRINLDPAKYGVFAEIGAGQEVARWFFRVGGASGTIAKSISAYDMIVSDAIYGHSERYVSRGGLQTMLEYEYQPHAGAPGGEARRIHAILRLCGHGGRARATTSRANRTAGWASASRPRRAPSPRRSSSTSACWIRRTSSSRRRSGSSGVNLIYAALYLHGKTSLVTSLLDNLTSARVEVDMIKFSGPGFAQVDNRLMALQLVQHGLTDAAMFTADGEVVQAAEVLYKKPILVERGSFRPVTHLTMDMLEAAHCPVRAGAAGRGRGRRRPHGDDAEEPQHRRRD